MTGITALRNLRSVISALILIAILTSCGGGGGRDQILGSGGVTPVGTGNGTPPGTPPAPPGTPPTGNSNCTSTTGPTIPVITASDPTNGNPSASTSTAGIANGGMQVSVTFSLPMNAATINAATFTLTPMGQSALVASSVTYDATTNVATLTTSAALLVNTSYVGMVSTAATTSATGTGLSCPYSFSFKTGSTATTGLAPINLGVAAPFAIAATAGVTNASAVPQTQIVGNVVLDPTATCNAIPVNNTGGFGLCAGSAPTIDGTVVTPTYPDSTTANAVLAALDAAFLSITPPAGPPAAGSLGGGTPIVAPTGLGAPTGSATVVGQNLFYPGVYTSATSILISNDFTLDAQGNVDAIFVFQSASTIDTAAGAPSPAAHTRILLINGAKASNVFWQAGSSATLGTYSEFAGSILASASITMTTGASSCGRLLAGAFTAGAFVFDSNTVSVPGNAASPAGCD